MKNKILIPVLFLSLIAPGCEPDDFPADLCDEDEVAVDGDGPVPGCVPAEEAADPSESPGDSWTLPVQDVPEDGGPGEPDLAPPDPFAPGPLAVNRFDIPADGGDGPPKDLVVLAPAAGGPYPVVVLLHGFLLAASYYSEVMAHLASHGFAVVAPQMYPPGGLPFGKPTAAKEAEDLVQVLDWLPGRLGPHLGLTVDHARTGIAGHSRGGKVAWILLSGDPGRAQAVAGIDPVDGTGGPFGNEPSVLAGHAGLPLPVLIVGAGLGPLPAGLLQIPCAPADEGHQVFFETSASPAFHVVAPGYGHQDVLDASTPGCGQSCGLCPSGPEDGGLRRLTGGLLAAFFAAALAEAEGYGGFLTDPEGMPVDASAEWK